MKQLYRVVGIVGKVWATTIASWTQFAVIAGLANSIMLLSITYTTVIKGAIPLWLYISAVVVGVAIATAFVLRIGLRAYYDFFNRWTAIGRVDARLKSIEAKLDAMNKESNNA